MSRRYQMRRETLRQIASDRDSTTRFIATEIIQMRARWILGAGFSVSAGLPDWKRLVDNAFKVLNVTPPSGLSPVAASTELYNRLNQNEDAFAETIRDALYMGITDLEGRMRTNATLGQLGEIVKHMRNAGPVQIVSFNFDTLLEMFLETVCQLRVASSDDISAFEDHDVTVYHPHGVLPPPAGLHPTGQDQRRSSAITFCSVQYDRGRRDAFEREWIPFLKHLLSDKTGVFLGLSGDCPNLTSMLVNTQRPLRVGAGADQILKEWGIRITGHPADVDKEWLHRGVASHNLVLTPTVRDGLTDAEREAASPFHEVPHVLEEVADGLRFRKRAPTPRAVSSLRDK